MSGTGRSANARHHRGGDMARARSAAAPLAVALVLLVSSCGGTATDPDAGVSGTIRLLVFGAPEELKAFRDLVTAFRRVEPGVAVKLVEASDREDLLTRLSTSFAGGTPPDLFLLNYRFYAQFAAKRVLEPVEDWVAASTVFQQRDFHPQALDAFRFGGKLTCLPQNISSLVVYYNRSMFRRAGLADPRAGWTWDDMVGAARALTRDADGDGRPDQHGLGVDPEVIRLAPFVWSNGGQLVDDTTRPTAFRLQEPAAVEALRRFLDLHRVHRVVPGQAEAEAESHEARFQNGRLGMIMSSRRSTPAFRQITAFDWDVAALPRLAQPASVLHSDAWCMTAASGNKDAAWRFMELALGPDGQRITAATGRTVPSLIELSTSAAFLDPKAKPASSRVFVDTIPVVRRLPSVSTWPEIEDVANAVLERAFYRDQPAAATAAEIVEQTRPIFARAAH
jgi:multiple sugar transport system substrate-binding protein